MVSSEIFFFVSERSGPSLRWEQVGAHEGHEFKGRREDLMFRVEVVRRMGHAFARLAESRARFCSLFRVGPTSHTLAHLGREVAVRAPLSLLAIEAQSGACRV